MTRSFRVFAGLGVLTLAACGGSSSAPARPALANGEGATLVRFASTATLKNGETVSYGVTLDFRSASMTPPGRAVINASIAAFRARLTEEYATMYELAATPKQGVKVKLGQAAALAVFDPRYRIPWLRVDWVVSGPTFRASPEICLQAGQQFVADSGLAGVVLCEPYLRGFTRPTGD